MGIQELKKLRIPRWIGTSAECQIEFHGFCDASLDAYAAVVYVRVQNANKPVKIVNLCAKTKVAPIKVMSLPRLELCGATLLVKLIDDVMKAMQWPTINVRCWTDSTIVLAWLRGHPSSFNVFVANQTATPTKGPRNHKRNADTGEYCKSWCTDLGSHRQIFKLESTCSCDCLLCTIYTQLLHSSIGKV